MSELNKIEDIIAVTTYGRAGSGLISSLFDGHSKILSFPDCYIKSFYKFWKKNENKSIKNVIKTFLYYYSIYFDPTKPANFLKLENNGKIINKKIIKLGLINGFSNLGIHENEKININKKKFTRQLLKIFEEERFNRRNFFLAIHLVYTKLYNSKIKPPYKIIYLLHSPDKLDLVSFLEDFPNSKFIQMIREPVSSFSSAVNSTIKNGYFKKIVLYYYTAFFTKLFIPPSKKILYIKLENLHNKPAKIMRVICKFIKLNYEKNLLNSTFFKKVWHNEKSSKKISGFSENFIKRRNENFTKFDFYRLEFIFRKNIKLFKYNQNNHIIKKNLIYLLLLLPFNFESKIQENYGFLDYLFYRARIFKYMFVKSK
jgi:hypothetical protein